MTPAVGVAAGLAAARAAAEYYLERQISELAQRTAAYYARNEQANSAAIEAGQGCAVAARPDMPPEVARALGLDPTKPVTLDELTNLLAGLRADGAEIEGSQRGVGTYKASEPGAKDRHRIAYLDLTISAPKSVSLAWAFAETEAERAAILEAHKTAVAETLRYVEQQVGWARTGKGGEGPLERARFGWLTLEHFTSRPTLEIVEQDPVTGERYTALKNVPVVAGDPQLHSHNLIPSVMVTESGRVVALNTALFPGRYHEFGAVYDSILGRELNKLGMHTELDARTNKLRLTAIPQAVCDEFSKRARDGQTAARALAQREGRDWDAMSAADQANLIKLETHRSRRDKETNTPDMEAWRQQAERIGWHHRSAVACGPEAPERSYGERMAAAERVALRHLEEMLSKSAVLDQGDVRLAAARGFIAAGLDSTGDLDAMMRRWASATVMQEGQETHLVWRVVENGRIKLTTALHREQEEELVALARRAVDDRTHALSSREIAAAVNRSGLVFKGGHGEAQHAAIEKLGTEGDLAILIGVGGAGKTTLLSPLVAAWKERDYTVWGTADANTQAVKLTEAGIDYIHTRAIKPLLDSLNDGRSALNHNSVLVLDELSRVGTRELLALLRHRERIGFKLVTLGDDRQIGSIESGSPIALLRPAIGEERVAEILTSIRQRGRAAEVAGMFRNGEIAQAVAAKRADGTAELVDGGYRQAVERVAALWEQRYRATNCRPDYRITISAPSNHDAREIGRAIRQRRRAMGEITGPDHARRATDGRGEGYLLELARGDDVRLFRRTRAVFQDENGRKRSADIGDNGSVLRIEAVMPAEGLMLRARSGKVGFVSWRELRDHGTGRTLLSWGSCLTIDSAQSLTSDEHINAMPGGSRAVTGRKGYVAESRHRVASYLVGSAGGELRQARERRPRGIPEPQTPEERQRAAWANLVRNFERSGAKENATDLLERSSETRRRTVNAFQSGLCLREAREAAGQKPTVIRENAEQRGVREALPQLAEAVEHVAREQTQVATGIKALDAYLEDREERRIRTAALMVAEGLIQYHEAKGRIVAAILHDRDKDLPRDPVHGFPQRPPGSETVDSIEKRVEARLEAAIDKADAALTAMETAAYAASPDATLAARETAKRAQSGMQA